MYRLGSTKFVTNPTRMYICDEHVEKEYYDTLRLWSLERAKQRLRELIDKTCEPMTKYVVEERGLIYIVDPPPNKVLVVFDEEGRVCGFYRT